MMHDDADAGRVTYLAVNRSRSVDIYQVKDYVQEAGNASEGVNLTKLLFSPHAKGGWESQKLPAVTDPNRPAVGSMTPDDIELVVEGCEELPARGENWST